MHIDITWRAGVILLALASIAAVVVLLLPWSHLGTEWWWYIKTNSCRGYGIG